MELKIYLLPGPHLLPRLHERLIPYFEQRQFLLQDEVAKPSPSIARRFRRKIVAAYRSLADKFPLHERLCTALSGVRQVHIHYPENISREEAHRAFQHFLRAQATKHRFWTIVNGFLAVLGSLLMPLPGPNIFFFYPAVRAFSHQRAYSGARMAMQLGPVYDPEPRLAQFLNNIHGRSRKEIARLVEGLALDLDLHCLPEFYRKYILHKHSQRPPAV